jgi:cold shock CspA family protein
VERLRGRVLWFSEEKGWGMVRDERGHLYHLEYSEIAGEGLRAAVAGQPVEFSRRSAGRTAVAVRVVALEGGSDRTRDEVG